MLISYALLIFALTFPVVAPPPQQASGLKLMSGWAALDGNRDSRLVNVKGPNDVVYRWYRLKTPEEISNSEKSGDRSPWPRNRQFDDAMELIPVKGRIRRVSYLKLQRVVRGHRYHLLRDHPQMVTTGIVYNQRIPLVGFWGRAAGFNPEVPAGSAGPAVLFDEVIEIKQVISGKMSTLKRQIRFLDHQEHAAYLPALTVYELTKEWAALQGSEDPRLLEVPPDLYHWFRIKLVVAQDYPTWPEDVNLDQVIQLRIEDGRIDGLSLLKLRRVAAPDEHSIHLISNAGYEDGRVSHFNDMAMRLDGFWARANKLNISDHVWKLFVVVPHAQVYSRGLRARWVK
ncbi:hypothetical protein AX14_003691 [Amanita brunnescens Koide BX004]|nr:hypothetical protein AX14_003691 [Amanita brunnescens Koide BX004]